MRTAVECRKLAASYAAKASELNHSPKMASVLREIAARLRGLADHYDKFFVVGEEEAARRTRGRLN
jgi:hypothetical protein